MIEKNYKKRISSLERINQIADTNTFKEFEIQSKSSNFLNIDDYDKKIEQARESSGTKEGIISGFAEINKKQVILSVMDPFFMAGSIGTSIGNQIKYSLNKSLENNIPFVLFIASSGARMQEGMFSLITLNTIQYEWMKLKKKNILSINVLTDPTMGGASASFAFLADYIIAEKDSQIGFAGKRVIEQISHKQLPDNFQDAENFLKLGIINEISERKLIKDKISDYINEFKTK